MYESAENSEGKFLTNINKFRSEVLSVHGLLLAENDRLTELKDKLETDVDKLRERVNCKLID